MKSSFRVTGIFVAVFFLSLLVLQAKKSESLKSLQVGKPAPNFTLPDSDGKTRSLADYRGKYVVLEWINHGCPFVKKHYESNNMQTLQKDITAKGVVWLSISSSAKGKQGYMTAEEWKSAMKEKGMASTAVLLDPKGKVGREYGARTTPHLYVINPEGTLIYQGAIDDKPTADKSDIPGANNYVKGAIKAALSGQPVSMAQTEPYGCSVKYQ